MAKIIISSEGTLVKEVELNKERMTIGRRPHNNIVSPSPFYIHAVSSYFKMCYPVL